MFCHDDAYDARFFNRPGTAVVLQGLSEKDNDEAIGVFLVSDMDDYKAEIHYSGGYILCEVRIFHWLFFSNEE